MVRKAQQQQTIERLVPTLPCSVNGSWRDVVGDICLSSSRQLPWSFPFLGFATRGNTRQSSTLLIAQFVQKLIAYGWMRTCWASLQIVCILIRIVHSQSCLIECKCKMQRYHRLIISVDRWASFIFQQTLWACIWRLLQANVINSTKLPWIVADISSHSSFIVINHTSTTVNNQITPKFHQTHVNLDNFSQLTNWSHFKCYHLHRVWKLPVEFRL